jgi:hypothetical protein
MSSKGHMPHSIIRNAYAIADQMEPLKKKKDPAVAAVLGFAFGGVGLGLYLESWMDFLLPWGILMVIVILGIPFGEAPVIFAPVFWAIYAYRRVKASNAKLEGRGRKGIIEAEIVTEPPPVQSVQRSVEPQRQLQMNLRRLDDLLAEGVLTPSEHAAKRTQLLSEF